MTTQRKVSRSDAEWRAQLTPEQYEVTRHAATEAPFTGEYDRLFEDGVYTCVCCGEQLFDSVAKYDHGCGWPSFTEPVQSAAVEEHADSSHGMYRTEVVCTSCGAHLGHVFQDGPAARGGQRYCINSASLRFEED